MLLSWRELEHIHRLKAGKVLSRQIHAHARTTQAQATRLTYRCSTNRPIYWCTRVDARAIWWKDEKTECVCVFKYVVPVQNATKKIRFSSREYNHRLCSKMNMKPPLYSRPVGYDVQGVLPVAAALLLSCVIVYLVPGIPGMITTPSTRYVHVTTD